MCIRDRHGTDGIGRSKMDITFVLQLIENTVRTYLFKKNYMVILLMYSIDKTAVLASALPDAICKLLPMYFLTNTSLLTGKSVQAPLDEPESRMGLF